MAVFFIGSTSLSSFTRLSFSSSNFFPHHILLLFFVFLLVFVIHDISTVASPLPVVRGVESPSPLSRRYGPVDCDDIEWLLRLGSPRGQCNATVMRMVSVAAVGMTSIEYCVINV